MALIDLIEERRDEIIRIALRHGAENVRLFGSAARGAVGPSSDVDFLVEMKPDHSPWFPAGLTQDLEDLLGRRVHVVTSADVSPIKTEDQYTAALRKIREIWRTEMDTPESDHLEILMALVEAYEEQKCPIDPPDPIDAIKFRMEQMGLTKEDLEPFVGTMAAVDQVLEQRRSLTLEMIRKLHANLGIPAEILIGEYPLKSSEAASGH